MSDSQRYQWRFWFFPKGILPSDNFLRGNFQICNFPSGNFPNVLGLWGAAGCNGGRAPWLGHTWRIAHLGSYNLVKYPLEVDNWEKSFGKVSNIPNIPRNTLSDQKRKSIIFNRGLPIKSLVDSCHRHNGGNC